MKHQFTEQAQKVLETAEQIAHQLKHHYIGSEHLLVALLSCEGVAAEVLEKHSVEKGQLYLFIDQLITPVGARRTKEKKQYTPRTEHILQQSIEEPSKHGCTQAGTEHILLAILQESDCAAKDISL